MTQFNQFWLYCKSLFQYSPWIFTTGCLLTFINTLLTGVGMLLLIPLLHYAGWLNQNRDNNDFLTSLLNSLPGFHGKIPLLTVLLVFLAVIFFIALIDYWQNKFQVSILQNYLYELRNKFSYLLARAKWPFLLNEKLQHYEHMVGVGLQQVAALNNFFILLISESIIAILYISFSFLVSAKFSLLTLAVLVLMAFFFIKNQARLTGQKTFYVNRSLQTELANCLEGIKLAKVYNLVFGFEKRFQKLNNRLRQHMSDFFSNQRQIKLFYRISTAILFVIVFYFATTYLQVSLLSMLGLLIIYSRLVPRILSLQQNCSRISNLLPVFNEMQVMLCDLQKQQDVEFNITKNSISLKNSIQFKQVVFSYQAQISMYYDFTIPAQVTSAIIGESGAGKSTLADLLLGLLLPSEGSILIDGHELRRENIGLWRNCVAYVPQETFLFHDTIKNNLYWANEQAVEEEIWQSLTLAAADDFVRKLPNGLDTIIGDRGIHLSGGERQRLGLARALLRKPQVLVLDEATSALDQANEQKLFNSLKQLHGKLTIIIIAHRLSTIQLADHLFLLKAGRVVEQGARQSLLASSKQVAELFQADLI